MSASLGVSRVDWTFKTTFKVSEEQMKEPCVDLVFEGLDTYCDIEVVSMLVPLRRLGSRRSSWPPELY